MRHGWTIIPERELGVVQWGARVTAADIVEMMRAMFASEAWKPGYRHLWDGRFVCELDLGVEGTWSVVRELWDLRERMGHGRACTVLRRDFHLMGADLLIRLGELDERQVRIFSTISGALEWLGVPEDAPELARLIRPE